MSTFTVSMAPDNSTDATYRVWTKAIFDTIIAGGWIQASDTGQINFTTVTKPTVINTVSGYSILRMNDSLQSTVPVFMKLEYGCGSSLTYPALFITLGVGSDGSGNLTTPTSTRIEVGPQAGNATVYQSKLSVASNRLIMWLWPSASLAPIICIERTHDSSGGDTTLGVMLFAYGHGSATASVSGILLFAGPVTANNAYWNTSLPPPVTSNAWNTDVYLYPVRTWGAGESSPSNQMMLYYNQDLTQYNVINVKMWDGVTRPMYPIGIMSVNSSYGASTSISSLAMRWD